MRRRMGMVLVLLAAMALLPHVCTADNRGAVYTNEPYVVIGGVAINSVNVASKAAADPTTYSDAIPVGTSEVHSIAIKWEAEDALASFDVAIQGMTKWGDWVAFNPPVSVTCAGASGSKIEALVLPLCSEIRIAVSSDATYATTVTACTINRW